MIPNPYSGAFFALEGIDGCGKSTQADKLVEWVNNLYPIADPMGRNIEAMRSKEPDKEGLYGREIYNDLYVLKGLHVINPFGFQRWYACDSKDTMQKKVIPALNAGVVVVSDRYRPSMVYGARAKEEIAELMRINEAILGEHFIWPDAVFIVDTPEDIAIERLNKKGRVLDDHEKSRFLRDVRAYYGAFAMKYPKCHMIDGSQSIDEIFDDIRHKAEIVLKTKGIIK
jgi:dTMP kinase